MLSSWSISCSSIELGADPRLVGFGGVLQHVGRLLVDASLRRWLPAASGRPVACIALGGELLRRERLSARDLAGDRPAARRARPKPLRPSRHRSWPAPRIRAIALAVAIWLSIAAIAILRVGQLMSGRQLGRSSSASCSGVSAAGGGLGQRCLGCGHLRRGCCFACVVRSATSFAAASIAAASSLARSAILPAASASDLVFGQLGDRFARLRRSFGDGLRLLAASSPASLRPPCCSAAALSSACLGRRPAPFRAAAIRPRCLASARGPLCSRPCALASGVFQRLQCGCCALSLRASAAPAGRRRRQSSPSPAAAHRTTADRPASAPARAGAAAA